MEMPVDLGCCNRTRNGECPSGTVPNRRTVIYASRNLSPSTDQLTSRIRGCFRRTPPSNSFPNHITESIQFPFGSNTRPSCSTVGPVADSTLCPPDRGPCENTQIIREPDACRVQSFPEQSSNLSRTELFSAPPHLFRRPYTEFTPIISASTTGFSLPPNTVYTVNPPWPRSFGQPGQTRMMSSIRMARRPTQPYFEFANHPQNWTMSPCRPIRTNSYYVPRPQHPVLSPYDVSSPSSRLPYRLSWPIKRSYDEYRASTKRQGITPFSSTCTSSASLTGPVQSTLLQDYTNAPAGTRTVAGESPAILQENTSYGLVGPKKSRPESESTCEESCSICLENYGGSESIWALPCGHYGHRHCFDEWLKISSTCPICRIDIK